MSASPQERLFQLLFHDPAPTSRTSRPVLPAAALEPRSWPAPRGTRNADGDWKHQLLARPLPPAPRNPERLAVLAYQWKRT